MIFSIASDSYIGFIIKSMGTLGFTAFVLNMVLFVGAIIVIMRASRINVLLAYMLFIPIPVMISLMSSLQGTLASFSVVAISNVDLSQPQIMMGITEMAANLLASTILTVPTYTLLSVAVFVQVLKNNHASRSA